MRKAVYTIICWFLLCTAGAQTITPTGSISVCGGPQLLSVSGGSVSSYRWQLNNADIAGATALTYSATASGAYRVIINSGTPTADTLGPVNVTINAFPDANFTFTPTGQCSNVPVHFTNTSTGGVTYLWDFGDTSSRANNISTAANPSHVFVGTPGNGTQTFTIKLVTKTTAGCADSTTKTITTKQIPDGTLGGTGKGTFEGKNYFKICGNFDEGDFTFSNQSKTIATNTNYRIVWGDGSPDFTSGADFTTTVQHTYPVGTHQLLFIINGQNGCVDTTEYFVFVGTNPAVGFANPGNTAICSGEPLTFPITETTNNAPGTMYTVTFTDGSPPNIYIHPNVPASVTHNFELTSCGTFSSDGTNTYWNAFSARIVAANPCALSSATIVPIYVSEKPVASFIISPNDTICLNTPVTIKNTSQSSSVDNGVCTQGPVIWSISPATGWNLTSGTFGNDFGSPNPSVWQSGSQILTVNFTQPGVYTVRIKTGTTFCGINESFQTICVNPLPTASFTIDKNMGCGPLVVNTKTTTNTPTCGTYKYIWSINYTAATSCDAGSLNYNYQNGTNATSAEPEIQFNNPGIYTLGLVVVSPANGCSTQVSTKTITVKGKPVVVLNDVPASVCQNTTINPKGLINCSIDAATTYSWIFPGGTPASSSVAEPGPVFYSVPGNYSVTLSVTNECGTTTVTSPIIVQPSPLVTVPADISVCAGETIGPLNFTSTPSAGSFSWTNSNPAIGIAASGNNNLIPAFTAINNTGSPINSTISVTAKIGNCTNTESFNIVINPRPPAPVVQNVSYCIDEIAAPLTATITTGNSLLWYTVATGGTGSNTAPVPVTTVAGSTTYYVSQVSATTSCEGLRVPITVTVNKTPSIISAIGTDPVNCASATGSITLTGLDANTNYQVSYTRSGINVTNNFNSNSGGNIIIPNLTSGSYNNIYVILNGCPSNIASAIILSDPNPPATPDVSNTGPVCSGENVIFTASTSTTGNANYQWTGPGNFNSTQQNPSINNTSLAANGDYYVTVTINNCTSAPAVTVLIVNPLPAPPAVSPVAYCIDAAAVPLNATGSSLLWFPSTSGGTGTSTTPVPNTGVAGNTAYYVSQTSTAGCESERTILNVLIHPNAKASFNPPSLTGCPPFLINNTAIGLQPNPANSQYHWYANNVLIGSGADFPGYIIPTANDSVMIKLVTVSANGCKPDSMSHEFFTYKLPSPSFTLSGNEGCGPLSILVNNTTADIDIHNYQWDFGNGQTSVQAQPGLIQFLPNPNYTDTVYYVKLKMLSACDTLVVEKPVYVTSKPKALFTPDHTEGCSPMKVVFRNTSKGLGNTYYWDFGDGQSTITNSNDMVQHTYFTGRVDTFNVRLIAANSCGNDTLQYAIITAPNNINLNFAMNGPDHFGCAPHTVALINNTPGANSFQWNFGDGNILSTSKNVDTVFHTYLIAGEYMVSLKAQNNCTDTTATDQISVFPKPNAAFIADRYNVCKGDPVSFTNQSVSGTSYFWDFGDGTVSVLENPSHVYTTPGNYNVVLKVFSLNTPGSICTDSVAHEITVNASLPGSFTVSDSSTLCAPLTVNFVNENQPSVSAIWDFGDGTTGTGNSISHTYLFSGNYQVTLTVTVPGGCVFTSNKPIRVNGPSGTLSYTGGYNCSPASIRLEAIASNTGTYHWDFGDGQTEITTTPVVYHSYQMAGNYLPSVSLKNTTGCDYFIQGNDTIKTDKIVAGFTISQQINCGSTLINFIDTSHAFSGKEKVLWNFGDGSTGTGSDVNHSYLTAGDYWIEMIITSKSGCVQTIRKQVNIPVNNKPLAAIVADMEACAKIPVVFTANVQSTDALNIQQWTISNGVSASGATLNYAFNTPGIYTVRFISGTENSCFDTAFHSITIKPSPTVRAGADVTLCKGNSAQLSVSGALQYQWTPLQGLSCTSCTNPVAIPEFSTPYVVAGYNNIGCPGYDTVNVTIIQPMELTTSGNDSICIGQSANLMVSGGATYVWSPSTGLSNSTSSNPVATPTVTTAYRVIGYDGHRCFSDTALIVVAVGRYPTIDLGPDQTLATGTIFPLTSTVVNGPVKNWLWEPATDLDCAGCPQPKALIKKDITYSVEITNIYGCKATDSIQIKVFCKDAQVFIPNAFSPDGDGINDVLMVRATGIATVKTFRIYNRWGEMIFERNNFSPNEPSFGWDGKIRGKSGPPEVYVYTAEVMCENGVSFTYKGNTTILK